MKFTLAIISLLVAAVASQGPIEVSHNNIGDIVTVGVNLEASLSSNIDTNIVTVLLALLNQQAAIINGNVPEGVDGTADEPVDEPAVEEIAIEEMIQPAPAVISPEVIAAKVQELKNDPQLFESIQKLLNQV
jgi:hypothetical protein